MENNGVTQNGNTSLALPHVKVLPDEGLLHIILLHRWIILSTVIGFLFIAMIYLFKTVPIYTSSSRLYVEQNGPRIISDYEGVMTKSKNYLYTQGELIRSTPIVASVAENPELKQFKTFANTDNIVGCIKGNLNVDIGKRDDIITVSFNCPYPAEASQIVNEIVNSYVEYHTSHKRSTVFEVLKILQKEKVKRDAELSEKFAQMLDFTRKNGVVSFEKEGGHVIFQKLTKLSEALTDAQLAAINAKADYEATKSMINEPAKIKQFAAASSTGVHVVVNDIESQLRSELKETEVQLRNARFYCTEDHPSIKAIKIKIDNIKQQLNEHAKEFADAYLEVNRLKLETARQREAELQGSYDAQCKASQDLGIQAAEYSILQSELKRTERLCEILDNRIKELNVTEDTGALNITLLEIARPALVPSKPQKAKIMMMALIMGLMFGCGLALVRDFMDYRLRSAEEISAMLGVPVLGVIPTMAHDFAVVTSGQKLLLLLKTSGAKLLGYIYRIRPEKWQNASRSLWRKSGGEVISQEIQSMVVERGQKILLKPRSIAAEAYRTIRTAVFFGVPKGQAKTILVTSPAPGDGKSTLASNLAIAMAQAGQKTLIMDADLRKPMQHNIFQVDREKGLSVLLSGSQTLEQAIQPGPVSGLDILTCGPEVPNPSEILNSEIFEKDLENLTQLYDRVIIDSPPVAPVADSQILSAMADITVLVLRAEKSTRRQSQVARDSLQSVGGRLLGAVVNDVPRKGGHYGYYSKYGHYGRYGHYGEYYGHKEKKKEQEQKVSV